MSLTAVWDALNGELRDGRIDLHRAAARPALQPLRDILTRFAITTDFELSGAELSLPPPPPPVVLRGSGLWTTAGGIKPLDVVATLTVDDVQGGDHFVLTLTPYKPAPAAVTWTFDELFTDLPDCQRAGGVVVDFAPSFLIGLQLTSPAFVSGSDDSALHLDGSLPLNGDDLARVADLLAPWPLRLQGTVTPSTTAGLPARLDLLAVQQGRSMDMLGATLTDVGVQLRVVNDLDEKRTGRRAFSTLNLAGTLQVGGGGGITGTMTTQLLASGDTWRLMVVFKPGQISLARGLAELADLFKLPAGEFLMPASFPALLDISVTDVEIGIKAPTKQTTSPAVRFIAVTLQTDSDEAKWEPPVSFVSVNSYGARWLLTFPENILEPYMAGEVFGTIRFATDSGKFDLDVSASLPQFVITGQLAVGDDIKLDDLLRYYFKQLPDGLKTGLVVTALGLSADPRNQTYDASAEITTDWTIPLGGALELQLSGLEFEIAVSQGDVSGGIIGLFTLPGAGPPELPDPQFDVAAYYDADATGWTFAGRLYPSSTVRLNAMVARFLEIADTGGVPTLDIEALSVRFTTKPQTWALSGRAAARWEPELFQQKLPLSARASADLVRAENSTPVGTLSGEVSVNRITVGLAMNLKVKQSTYVFRVQFDQIWVSATTGWHTIGGKDHQTLTMQLGGVTLGEVLTYFVNLAAPTLGFSLDSPWDVLNRIELSRFKVTVDPYPECNAVSLTYDANLDLVGGRVDTVGVRYTRLRGESAVELILTGNILGKDYTKKPLSWDVVNEPPPSIPGKGSSLIDLRYAGMGQRVRLSGKTPNTVAETIKLLRDQMQPPKDLDSNPLKPPNQSKLEFAADSQWLIGFDATLLDTVALAVVFNDPLVYGLSLGLTGERAKSFAGLRFELLYKKITDDVGMFRVELQLPPAFRRLDFGSVSVTLGIIVVEVYTNGNFMVDLGFPYNRDYTRSFTVEAFPLIGRGGVYFGLLSGATSTRVPQISNGTFSPVLELGVGLAVGVGKEISAGPLSGGAYIQVEVVFQGVLAWFNPTSAGVAPDQYYWAQGIVALHGKVYGKVDFKIIKISVTIEAWAQATVVFEAYRAILFRLNVGVRVEAEVDVLFFSIRFSFSATLDVGLTVGNDRPTPWVVSGAAPARRVVRVPERRIAALRTEHVRGMHRAGLLDASAALRAGEEPYQLVWDPELRVFPNSPRDVALTMLPAFSVDGAPVDWTPPSAGAVAPEYRVALVLMAETGIAPRATREQAAQPSAERSAEAATAGELAARTLIRALLRWSIAAVTRRLEGTVTAGQMQLLAAQMDMAQTADEGFAWENLSGFFAHNLHLQIAGKPLQADGVEASAVGAMAFPIPPVLTRTSPTPHVGDFDFAEQNKVGPLYEWACAEYLNRFFPQPEPPRPRPDRDEPKESVARFVYRDWCLMVAKQAVQSARDLMSGWTFGLVEDSSLERVAEMFPADTVAYTVRAGDTVDSVAVSLGATPAELAWLNPALDEELQRAAPGAVIAVKLGVSPEAVAVDNAQVALAANVAFTVATRYQVAAGDTLSGIAVTRFKLADALALFQQNPALAGDRGLLRGGAAFAVPQRTVPAPAQFSAVDVAALYFDRYAVPLTGGATWYTQTILDLNRERIAGLSADTVLPAGTAVEVPQQLDLPQPSRTYTTQPGDTPMRIATALDLAQNHATGGHEDGDLARWPAFRDAVTLGPGATASIPALQVAVQPAESLDAMAVRLIAGEGAASPLAGLLAWTGGAAVLRELAVIDLSAAPVTTGGDLSTLSAIATRLGLSVEALAGQMAGRDLRIFAATKEDPLTLTIAHLAVQGIDALVDAVLDGNTPADIAGMSSRHLLGGLRLPALPGADAAAGQDVAPLYTLTGQQFRGPDLPAPPPQDDVALEVHVTVNPGFGWVELMSSAVVGAREDRALLASRHAELEALNPGLRAREPQTGMVVRTATTGELVYRYSSEQLAAAYPATTLQVKPTQGPAPMPLAGRTPLTYGLDHHVELQSPVALPVPQTGTAPLTGNGGLWPLPVALLDRARAGVTTPYDIVRASSRVDSAPPLGPQPDTLLDATFACSVPFGIRRVEGRTHVYELLGAGTADRGALLQIWEYLAGHDEKSGDRALLMLAPPPGSGNAAGLQVLGADALKTFLVKTNLSTETTPGSAALPRARAADATPSPYFASLAELRQFVLLLWEGSTVATGYWLGVSGSDGADLPQGAFDSRGVATLNLLFVAGEQNRVAPNGRALLPFNTAVITAPGLDPSTAALYVEAHDDSELITQQLVPPGCVGFTMGIEQPPDTLPAPPEVRLRQLFSMASYAVTEGAYPMGEVGVPVTPQKPVNGSAPLWRHERERRWARSAGLAEPAADDAPVWTFQQVLPITRFGPASVAPAVPGLPPRAGDPYRGIAGASDHSVRIRLGFADVLGNITARPSTVMMPAEVTR